LRRSSPWKLTVRPGGTRTKSQHGIETTRLATPSRVSWLCASIAIDTSEPVAIRSVWADLRRSRQGHKLLLPSRSERQRIAVQTGQLLARRHQPPRPLSMRHRDLARFHSLVGVGRAASPRQVFDIFPYRSYAAASERCASLGGEIAGMTDRAAPDNHSRWQPVRSAKSVAPAPQLSWRAPPLPTTWRTGAKLRRGNRNSHVATTKGAVSVGIPKGITAMSSAACTMTVNIVPMIA
jgi:hypothetical protein